MLAKAEALFGGGQFEMALVQFERAARTGGCPEADLGCAKARQALRAVLGPGALPAGLVAALLADRAAATTRHHAAGRPDIREWVVGEAVIGYSSAVRM